MDGEDFEDALQGFNIAPKGDCPHLEASVTELSEAMQQLVNITRPCGNPECLNPQTQENMICCKCGEVYCGRYVCMHMKEHSSVQVEHAVVASFSDFSFWCYLCDSYISSKKLNPWFRQLHLSKFHEEPSFYPGECDYSTTDENGTITLELQGASQPGSSSS
eukprot:Nk52_evm20s352 gene=Nk52_evmTU20s352